MVVPLHVFVDIEKLCANNSKKDHSSNFISTAPSPPNGWTACLNFILGLVDVQVYISFKGGMEGLESDTNLAHSQE